MKDRNGNEVSTGDAVRVLPKNGMEGFTGHVLDVQSDVRARVTDAPPGGDPDDWENSAWVTEAQLEKVPA